MIVGFIALPVRPRVCNSNPRAAHAARRGHGIRRVAYDARHHGRATAPHATRPQCDAWAAWIAEQPTTPARVVLVEPPRVLLADVIALSSRRAPAPRKRHDGSIAKGPDGWRVVAEPALGAFRTRSEARAARATSRAALRAVTPAKRHDGNIVRDVDGWRVCGVPLGAFRTRQLARAALVAHKRNTLTAQAA
jgi:hypothetical protein